MTPANFFLFSSFASDKISCASSTCLECNTVPAFIPTTLGLSKSRAFSSSPDQTLSSGLISIKKSSPRSSRELRILSSAPVTCTFPPISEIRLANPANVPMKVESIAVHPSRSMTTRTVPARIRDSPNSFTAGLFMNEPLPSQRIQLKPSNLPTLIGQTLATEDEPLINGETSSKLPPHLQAVNLQRRFTESISQLSIVSPQS